MGNGGTFAQLGQNLIQLLSQNGGYMLIVALVVVWLLCAGHLMSPRSGFVTLLCGGMAWCAAYIINTGIGWAAGG